MKFISSIITEASGSVAGSTYSRNANGAYIRNRSIPTNKNTSAQKVSRARFATAAQDWRDLNEAQRQTFADQAKNYPYKDKLGQTKTYTARQLNAKLNATLRQAGLGNITTCLPPVPDVPVTKATVVADTGAGTINLTEWQCLGGETTIPAGWEMIVKATSVAAGVSKAWKKSDFRVITKYPSGAIVTPKLLASLYEAVFGGTWVNSPADKSCIGFAFLMINSTTGQSNASPFVINTTITTI
jgi:hypothetical protein